MSLKSLIIINLQWLYFTLFLVSRVFALDTLPTYLQAMVCEPNGKIKPFKTSQK